MAASARNCVERCIGVLNSRFRCILDERTLRYCPEKAGQISIACAMPTHPHCRTSPSHHGPRVKAGTHLSYTLPCTTSFENTKATMCLN
ncbi:hypothetical protein QE152_g34312 [Popillia japonica]|uniref:Uncharacterized protein n=1 Tax=Popillia japonica TaxID=7064 RepID=A0AAW1ITG9_POPJA